MCEIGNEVQVTGIVTEDGGDYVRIKFADVRGSTIVWLPRKLLGVRGEKREATELSPPRPKHHR